MSRGGKRTGAGRKAIHPPNAKRVTLTITTQELEAIKRLIQELRSSSG